MQEREEERRKRAAEAGEGCVPGYTPPVCLSTTSLAHKPCERHGGGAAEVR